MYVSKFSNRRPIFPQKPTWRFAYKYMAEANISCRRIETLKYIRISIFDIPFILYDHTTHRAGSVLVRS